MSVINQMLRDLDARRAPQGASNVGAGGGAGADVPVPARPARRHANPRSRCLPVIVLVGTLAIGAAAYGDWPGLVSGRANAAAATATARAPVPASFDATPAAASLPDLAPPAAAREPAPLPSENRTVPPAPARSETLALRTPPALTPVANFLSTPALPASAAVPAPPLPAFYAKPLTMAEMIDQSVGRALDLVVRPALLEAAAPPLVARWEPVLRATVSRVFAVSVSSMAFQATRTVRAPCFAGAILTRLW